MKFSLLSILFLGFLILSEVAIAQVTADPPFRGDTAGVVNGRPLTRTQYLETFDQIARDITVDYALPLTEQKILEVHRKTWDQLIVAAIIDDSIEKKGITISNAEVRFELENNPPQALRRNFIDSMGTFDSQAYLSALRDPRNDSIVRNVMKMIAEELVKQKLSNMLIASVPVTDNELWLEYKKEKGATRKKFEKEKDEYRKKAPLVKQQAFITNWLESAKANAKIIDYRTLK